MVTVSRQVFLPLLAPILVPPEFSMFAPNPIQAGDTPSFLLTTAAPTRRLSPPVNWLDDLERRLTTYFTKKYPAYDFSPYTQEPDRIRGAVGLGDWWGAKRDMEDEEFGIVYPGSETEPPTAGGRAGNCSGSPNIGGRV